MSIEEFLKSKGYDVGVYKISADRMAQLIIEYEQMKEMQEDARKHDAIIIQVTDNSYTTHSPLHDGLWEDIKHDYTLVEGNIYKHKDD